MYPSFIPFLSLIALLIPFVCAHPATTSHYYQQKLSAPPIQNQIILKKDSGNPNAPPQSRIVLRGGARGGSGVFIPATANMKNERGVVIRIGAKSSREKHMYGRGTMFE